MKSDFILPRTTVINEIFALIRPMAGEPPKSVMLRAPPGSGKSSILELFSDYCRQKNLPVVEMTCADDGTSFGYQFEAAFLRSGLPADSMCIVVVDEAHITFKTKFLTSLVKKNYLVLAGATRNYSDTQDSPTGFELLTFANIRFTETEARSLWKLATTFYFPRNNVRPDFQISDELTDLVLRECGGHVIAIIITASNFAMFVPHFGSRIEEVNTELTRHFLSHLFTLTYSRIWLPSSGEFVLSDNVRTPQVQDYLITVVTLPPPPPPTDPPSPPPLPPVSLDVLKILQRSHFIDAVPENPEFNPPHFCFPLAQRRLMYEIFGKRTVKDKFAPISVVGPNSWYIHDFVLQCVQLFPQSVLQDAYLDRSSTPKEGVLQQLFLRSALGLVAVNREIVPLMSSRLNSYLSDKGNLTKGEIDFFINSSTLSWGIELLVNEDKLCEHQDRGKGKGKYVYDAIKEYRVVDFRVSGVSPKRTVPVEENDVVVTFSADFGAAVVKTQKQKVEVLLGRTDVTLVRRTFE
jgi:hypothetical protein